MGGRSVDKQRARHRVLTLAASLMKARGIKSVTMSEIAASSGTSKRTIYEMFRDKREIVYAVLFENFACYPPSSVLELQNPLVRMLESMKWGTREMMAFNQYFFDDLRQLYPTIWDEYRNMVKAQRLESTMKLIKQGVEVGIFRQELDYELTARLLFGVTRYLSNADIFPPERYAKDYVAESYHMLFIRGLATPSGLEMLEQYLARVGQL